MSKPLREAADLLRVQLAQKRKEVEELERLWIQMNQVARDYEEGGWIGAIPNNDEEDYV